LRGKLESQAKPSTGGQHDEASPLSSSEGLTGEVELAQTQKGGFQAKPEVKMSLTENATAEGRSRSAGAPGDGPADDDLILQTLDGNQDSFEVLVRRYSSRVFNIIGSFFRRRDMIEDIAQEVFAKSYFSIASFTIGRSFEAWVAKIAVNACYDHLRAQRRRSEHQTPQYAEQDDEWFELQMLEAARSRHNSAERQREAADIAERLLSKLEPEDRVVLVLMDRDGYSVGEISEMTGWGQSKVKVRAFRARRTLRAAMKRLLMSAERRQRSLQ
jgi:RNA polymerase sigma-70 factor (ECF subfamily)